MSDFELTSLVLSAAALAGVIASDVVFALQRREMSRQTARISAETRLVAADAMRSSIEEVGRALLTYPRLRPVFYGDEDLEGLEPLSEDDVFRARTIAENLLDAFQTALDLSEDVDVGWTDTYRVYFDDMMRRSDFLFDYLHRRSTWYPDQLLMLAENARRTVEPEGSTTGSLGEAVNPEFQVPRSVGFDEFRSGAPRPF